MAHYHTTVASKMDVETAFHYMADFSHSATWDPGVKSASQLSAGEIGLGTKFELVTIFNGREIPLTYEVTDFEPPHRVVLRAESDLIRSIDRVTFTPSAGGTDVTYDADLVTLGWLRFASPLVSLLFRRIGDRARAGLVRTLNE